MKNIQQVRKAFREARIVGEQLLSQGKITWEQFSFTMLGFEAILRGMGDDLLSFLMRMPESGLLK